MDDHGYAASPSKKKKTTDMAVEEPTTIAEKDPLAILPSPQAPPPHPSPLEVLLRQRLREAEFRIEVANQEAREAHERAEVTKNFYDSRTKKAEKKFLAQDKKREKEWTNKFAEVTSQLTLARKPGAELHSIIDKLTRENNELKRLQEAEKVTSEKCKTELTRENNALKIRIQEAEKVVSETCKVNIDLTREINLLKIRLQEAEKVASEKCKVNIELTRENIPLKIRLQEAEKVTRETCQANIDLHRHIAAHKHEMLEVVKKVNEKIIANVELVNEIDRLRAELHRSEILRLEQKQLIYVQQQPAADATAADLPQRKPVNWGISKKTVAMNNETDRINSGEAANVMLHDFCDPINIFQLVRPNTPDSMSLDSAFTALKLAYTKIAHDKWWRYRDINSVELYCETCGVVVVKVDILEHFLSAQHIQQVRDDWEVASGGCAVSQTAVQYWLRQMQLAMSVAAVVAVPTATPPAALAAAAAAVGELQRSAAAAAEPQPLFEEEAEWEVKEEIKEEVKDE